MRIVRRFTFKIPPESENTPNPGPYREADKLGVEVQTIVITPECEDVAAKMARFNQEYKKIISKKLLNDEEIK